MKHLAICIVLLLAVVPSRGGVVTLKNGTVLEGKIQATKDGFVVIDAAGKATAVDPADIASMQPDKPGAGSGTAGAGAGAERPRNPESDLASLRRAVAGVRDPKVAVDRYNAFLARQGNSPSASDAQKDLAQWQDRLDRKLVRVGDEWLAPTEVEQRKQQGSAVAREIAPLIAQNQFAQAEVALEKALATAPGNPALSYLQGLVQFRQNKLVPARKSFELVETALPDHAPTHNNLAVILWQTRAQIPAMAQYEKAMLADPVNQKVLDNVAEALHALPPNAAKNDVVKKVLGLFTAQDTALQKKMAAEQGLMRVGAQWVSAEEFKTIEASRKASQDQIEQYRKESIDLPRAIDQINQDLVIKTNSINTMMQQSLAVDGRGQLAQLPLPPLYYQLKQQVETMTADRTLKQRRLEQLPRLMADAQQQLSTLIGHYAGKQSVFDETGMPGAAPAATPAATQPATRPG